MREFSIGQKIVCINDKGFFKNKKPIVRGEIYTVEGLKECEKCGMCMVDVGVLPHNEMGYMNMVCKCGNTTVEDIWWFLVSRFAPLEEDDMAMSMAMDMVKEVFEKDNVKVKELEPEYV